MKQTQHTIDWEALYLKAAERGDMYLFFEKQGDGPRLYLQKVPEKKAAKTRVHLDAAVENLDTAVTRTATSSA